MVREKKDQINDLEHDGRLAFKPRILEKSTFTSELILSGGSILTRDCLWS